MIVEPKCFTRGCIHFTGIQNFSDEIEGDERPVCKAFPDGIPDDIAYGDNDHTNLVEGDNGIQFTR